MTTDRLNDRFRPSSEGPILWLWLVGTVRIAVLFVMAVGAYLMWDPERTGRGYLMAFYAFGLGAGLWYLYSLRSARAVTRLFTWSQLLVDFGVIAATVSFTGGSTSFFTFLFVIVILEAGLLLGLTQGFLFAALATVVMFRLRFDVLPGQQLARTMPDQELLHVWYNFLIQALAFHLTASISGYWSQRLRRMQQFQHEILDNMSNGFLIMMDMKMV